jgi:hypothetical protein
MAKGQKTGGRKKGVPNKRTQALQVAVENSGLTPLDFMLTVLRDQEQDYDVRLDAAKSAAPYIHPKLANIELTGRDKGPLEVNVVRFSDPAQRMGTPPVPDEGMDRARTGLPPRHPTLAPTKR